MKKTFFLNILFLITDILILYFFYQFTHAPRYFYFCAGILLLTFIFSIVYQKYLRKKLKKSVQKLIPIGCAVLVLLSSIPFVRIALSDLPALKNPSYMVLSNTVFFHEKHTIFGKTIGNSFYFTGTDSNSTTHLFYITEEMYNSFSYTNSLSEEDNKEKSSLLSYSYPASAEFRVEYMPASKRLTNLVSITIRVPSFSQNQETQDSTNSASDTQTADNKDSSAASDEETSDAMLGAMQAEITSVIDDSTMEATITDMGNFKSSEIKAGDAIKIQGTMTILYPFNIQGFYEIKAGDSVSFVVSSFEDGELPTVITSALNLTTESNP